MKPKEGVQSLVSGIANSYQLSYELQILLPNSLKIQYVLLTTELFLLLIFNETHTKFMSPSLIFSKQLSTRALEVPQRVTCLL